MQKVRNLVSQLAEFERVNRERKETLVRASTLEEILDRVKPYLFSIFNNPASVEKMLWCKVLTNIGTNVVAESLGSSALNYTLYVSASNVELTWRQDSDIAFEEFIVTSLSFACAISGYSMDSIYMSVRTAIDDYINHETDKNFSIIKRAGEYLFFFRYTKGDYIIEISKTKSAPEEKDLRKYLKVLHKAVYLNPVGRLRKYAPQLEFDENCISSGISSYDFKYNVSLPCGMLAFFGNRTSEGYIVDYITFVASADSKKKGYEVFLGMLHSILFTEFSYTRCLENRDYDGVVMYEWSF